MGDAHGDGGPPLDCVGRGGGDGRFDGDGHVGHFGDVSQLGQVGQLGECDGRDHAVDRRGGARRHDRPRRLGRLRRRSRARRHSDGSRLRFGGAERPGVERRQRRHQGEAEDARDPRGSVGHRLPVACVVENGHESSLQLGAVGHRHTPRPRWCRDVARGARDVQQMFGVGRAGSPRGQDRVVAGPLALAPQGAGGVPGQRVHPIQRAGGAGGELRQAVAPPDVGELVEQHRRHALIGPGVRLGRQGDGRPQIAGGHRHGDRLGPHELRARDAGEPRQAARGRDPRRRRGRAGAQRPERHEIGDAEPAEEQQRAQGPDAE